MIVPAIDYEAEAALGEADTSTARKVLWDVNAVAARLREVIAEDNNVMWPAPERLDTEVAFPEPSEPIGYRFSERTIAALKDENDAFRSRNNFLSDECGALRTRAERAEAERDAAQAELHRRGKR